MDQDFIDPIWGKIEQSDAHSGLYKYLVWKHETDKEYEEQAKIKSRLNKRNNLIWTEI